MAYVLAAAESAGLVQLQVRIDERDAGFTALGLALGSGEPAAVLTTSGTAVGNLLPAVMEANHSEVPLVVLSADRPEELRGTGANQTTRQAGLFGTAVRHDVDIAAGADPTDAVRTGLAAALGLSEAAGIGAEAIAAGISRLPGVRGPVQINIAFRDPLVPPTPVQPPDVALSPQRSSPAAVSPHLGSAAARGRIQAPPEVEPVVGSAAGVPPLPRAERECRTVVIAGAGAGSIAAQFAEELRLPLLAEPSSGARYGAAIGPYRLLVGPLGAQIERVVLFGRSTLSRPISALLAREDVETALYQPGPVGWYEAGRRRERLIPDYRALADFAGVGSENWYQLWQRAGHRAEAAIDEVLTQTPELTGVHLARAVWQDSARRGGQLVVGSSNPIRDVELAGRPVAASRLAVFANRGLAGIDGTVATATGIALANTEAPTRLLLGDLTLLHDAGGLLLGAGEQEPDLSIVVLNDAGGGIFSLLEHGRLGQTERYRAVVERMFGTPHSVDLAALSGAYGIAHQRVQTGAELDAALAVPIRGRSLLEVRADRADLSGLHERLKGAVLAAL